MLVKKHSASNFKPSTLTTEIWRIHAYQDNTDALFNCAFVKVKPQEESFAHKHHDAETFTIIQGEAIVNCDGVEQKVLPGDVIHFKPFAKHSIKNTSTTMELVYQTIWWEPILKEVIQQPKAMDCKTSLIFSALPTPNGDLHLGHLAGPYLAADMFYRYQVKNNKKTYHYVGVDRNQSYVAYLAEKLQSPTENIALHYHEKIKETLKMAGIQPIYYDEQTQYILETTHLFNVLYEKGWIVKQYLKTAYCAHCDAFRHEAFLLGSCKECKVNMSGSICENCFTYTREEALLQADCNICRNSINWIEQERFIFKLSAFKKQLIHFYCKTSMPEFAKSFCYERLDKLEDVPVSHCGNWGLKLSINAKSVHIYSVLELAARYISLVKELGLHESMQIVQCFGVDNMFNRLILIPALLMAYDEQISLPSINIINNFYLLAGKKFSTSRKHFIHISQLLDGYSLDAIRYYIAVTRPEQTETHFQKEDFVKIVEEQLINRWNTYLAKLSLIQPLTLKKEFSPGLWNDTQKSFWEYLKKQADILKDNYRAASFSAKKVCWLFTSIIDEIIAFIASQAPLFQSTYLESEQRTALYLIIVATKLVAYLIDAIMPDFAKKIAMACGAMEITAIDRIFDFLPEHMDIEQLYYHWKTAPCSETLVV